MSLNTRIERLERAGEHRRTKTAQEPTHSIDLSKLSIEELRRLRILRQEADAQSTERSVSKTPESTSDKGYYV